MKKRILLIGNGNHQLVYHFVKWMAGQSEGAYEFDLFNTNTEITDEYASVYKNIYPSIRNSFLLRNKLTRRIYTLLILNYRFTRIRKKYDIVHIQFARHKLASVLRLRRKSRNLVISVWGSDFYRRNANQRKALKRLLEKADIITGSNAVTIQNIFSYFQFKDKQYNIIRVGLQPLEELKSLDLSKAGCKEYFGINVKKKVVTIGYNGKREQNHIRIIELIKTNKDLLPGKDELFFLFPCTYGANKTYLSEIDAALQDFPYECLLLRNYMTEREVAILRKASDILIQLQPSDQLSGAMQEHLYAGNLVITGSWLPYSVLKEKGVYFKTIDDFDHLIPELIHCLDVFDDELNKARANYEIIYGYSSWPETIKEWINLYESLN